MVQNLGKSYEIAIRCHVNGLSSSMNAHIPILDGVVVLIIFCRDSLLEN